jgi:pyruvate formate lyase activating enzyme
MKIAGFEKTSLQDYPDHISCIVFTQGCNMKCPFCQNATLIPQEGENLIDEKEVLDYLKLRKNIVNGITISGGEPTLQKDLKEFIYEVKKIGVDVKLDTNGTNFNLIKGLIDEKLVDYVAMDIKNSFKKYGETVGIENIKLDNIKKSMNYLKKENVLYEFRTTIMNEHHELQDILEIIKEIGDSKYFLQNFKLSENVIDQNLTELDDDKLKLWNKILKKYKNVYIRGISKED